MVNMQRTLPTRCVRGYSITCISRCFDDAVSEVPLNLGPVVRWLDSLRYRAVPLVVSPRSSVNVKKVATGRA